MVYPVFIDTSLDTHLALIVSDTDAISDLKKKIIVEHPRCFPTIGKIEVHALQVKRKGHLYHLTDSMLVQNAFGEGKKSWFLYVDASSSENQNLKQHLTKPYDGNQLALPWITNSPSSSRHDILVDKSCKRLSHHHDSSPLQPGKRVLGVDGSSQGGSCQEIPKYVETEDGYINANHWKTVYSDSNKRPAIALQRQDAGSERILSKKRIRDVQRDSSLEGISESGCAAKKKRKRERNESSRKAFEKDDVLITTTNDVTSKACSDNLETYPLEQRKSRNAISDGLFAEALDDDNLSSSVIQMKRIKKNRENNSAKSTDQLVTVGPNVHEVDEKRNFKNKVEIFHSCQDKVSNVAVVAEKNIHHGPLSEPSGISQKNKVRKHVQEVIEGTKEPCSPLRGPPDEVFPTSLIMELYNLKKIDDHSAHNNVGFDDHSFEGDQFDKFEQDKVMSLSHDPEVKLSERDKHVYQGDKDVCHKEPLRASKLSDPKGVLESENTGADKRKKKKKKTKKSAAINDDEPVLKVVKKSVNISGPIPAFDGHLIDETRNDEIILFHNEVTDISDRKATGTSSVGADRDADKVIGNEADFLLATETISQWNPENMNEKSRKKSDNTTGSKRRKKSTKVSAARNEEESVLKQENNALSAVEKEKNILSHSDRKEISEEKSIEESQMTAGREGDTLIGNDAELLPPIETNRILDEKDDKEKSKEYENTKGSKRKKKVKKSAARNENALAVGHANDVVFDTDVPNPASDGHLIEKLEKDESVLIHTKRTGIPVEKSMDASHQVPDRESDHVAAEKEKNILSHSDRKEISVEKSIEESRMTAGREGDTLIGNDAELLLPIETNRILDEKDDKEKSKEYENTNGSKRKKKVKKSAARNENALAVGHANDVVFDTDVPNPASDGHLIEKLEKDESVLIHTTRTGIPVEKSMDASHHVPERESDHVAGSEAETLLPSEINKNQENVHDKSKRRRKKNQNSTPKSSAVFLIQKQKGAVDHLQLNQVDRNQEYAPDLDNKSERNQKSAVKAHPDLPCKDKEVGLQEFPTTNANIRDICKLTSVDITSKTMKITGAGTSKASSLEQSVGLEFEPVKSNGFEQVASLSEKISKDVCLSEVPPSLVLEKVVDADTDDQVDVSNRVGEGIDFKQYFVPGQPHTELTPTNGVKEVRKLEKLMKEKINTKKLDVPSVGTSPDRHKSLLSYGDHGDETSQMNFTITESQRPLSKVKNTEVLISSKKSPKVSADEMKAPDSHHIDQFKTPKKVRQPEVAIVSRTDRSGPATKGNNGSLVGSSLSSESSDRSRRGMVNKKRDLSLDHSNMAFGNTVARNSGKFVNNSKSTKSLLATPGAIFGDDSSNSSADDNGTVNSDASTRTPSDKSSSSELEGESDSSLDSGRTGSYAAKRKGARNYLVDSQSSDIGIMSVNGYLRSSSRFKKAKLMASQLPEDSEDIEFVPDSEANP